MRSALAAAVGLCAALCLCGCPESRRNLISDPGRPSSSSDANIISAADSSSNTLDASAPIAYCGGRPCSCADGMDNDSDGLIDGLDPECTGAYDDDEASFATGRPSKQAACRDCYWDANNGNGDDQCRYPAECFSDSSFVGKGNCSSCGVSDHCETYCKARTPNGCDCFGCCAVQVASGNTVYIQLVDTCTIALASDPNACPRCTLHDSCRNDCARCELCPGKRLADLPADCRSAYVCDPNQDLCSAAEPCAPGFYCQQGCCLPDLL